MTVPATSIDRAALPAALDRRFEAVVLDWDGTAVPDRQADASRVRGLIEELCGLGLDVAVITGTHIGNVDGQLSARPNGPGRLYLCMNRGSEVFCADAERRAPARAPRGDGRGERRARRGRREHRRRARRPRAQGRDRLPAPEPSEDRPHPGAGVGRSAEGEDRRAPCRGPEPSPRSGPERPSGGGRARASRLRGRPGCPTHG